MATTSWPTRRKTLVVAAALALLPAALPAQAADPLPWVDPRIGTGAHGHTYPGAVVPGGMVQLSPDTRTETWDGSAGYHRSDSSIIGFSHLHLSGTGIGDLGDVLVMTGRGPVQWERGSPSAPDSGYRARFRHADETAQAGHYAVHLRDERVLAELTATTRVGIHRYRYGGGPAPYLLLDLRHGIGWDWPTDTYVRQLDDSTLVGYRMSSGWARDQRVYFALRSSRPIRHLQLRGEGRTEAPATAAGLRGRWVQAAWQPDLGADSTVVLRVAVSAVDSAGALRNLQVEAPHNGFDAYRHQAQQQWRTALAQVQLTEATEVQRRTYYTALYHWLLTPQVFADVDGRYQGADGRIHAARGFTHRSVFSLWDTYRAAHPLYTLLRPDLVPDLVASMQAHQRQTGLLPIWTLLGNETYTMIGYHSVPVLADAIRKGLVPRPQADSLLHAMIGAALRNTPEQRAYAQYGYVPADAAAESVSKTLEYAYDDACIARTAHVLGEIAWAETFARRAEAWRHVFDTASGFARGRLRDGSWRTPFAPNEASHRGGDFTEANSWQYTWSVQHDVAGLMAAMGGPEVFVQRLDSLFDTTAPLQGDAPPDISGLIGQYAHGNEPSHHVAYLYNHAGRWDRTRARIRQIAALYGDSPEGLCGNEDCGQMSAWYLFSALGFYPADPALPYYQLGMPLVGEARIRLAGGRILTVRRTASPDGSARVLWNGKPLAGTSIAHAQLVRGGTLVFQLPAAELDY